MITKNISGSVANVVCGFDVLGFALETPYDEMSIEINSNAGQICITHNDNYNLPTDANKNVAGVALQALLNAYHDKSIGFNLVINKKIKPGSGLGSSAASAAGAVIIANEILGFPFTKEDLTQFAMEGEALASGARHADNLAPCIYGGFTIVRSIDPIDIINITAPALHVTIIHPQIEIKTSEARKILPTSIPLKTATAQWANVAALVAGMVKADYALISRSLQDIIVEPARKSLIPQYDALKRACLDAGALGGGISGSGPSVFMLSETLATANAVEKAMQDVYAKTGIEFYTYVTKIKN